MKRLQQATKVPGFATLVQFLLSEKEYLQMRPFRLRQLLAVQVAAQASIFMLQIVAVPMFLSRWGAELYGAWLTLISVSYFLSQVDIGFGSAAGVAMTAAIMGGNYEYARTLFWTS